MSGSVGEAGYAITDVLFGVSAPGKLTDHLPRRMLCGFPSTTRTKTRVGHCRMENGSRVRSNLP